MTALFNIKKDNPTIIKGLKVARGLSFIGSWVSYIAQIGTFIWHAMVSIPSFLKTISPYFLPITYALDGLRALFDMGIFLYRKATHTSSHFKKKKTNPYVRAISNILLIGLNAVAVAAALGAIMTGIGLIAIAAAMTVSWFREDMTAWWHTEKKRNKLGEHCKKLKDKIKKITKTHQAYTKLKKALRAHKKELKAIKAICTQKRLSALWGTVGIVGMALLSCGPFGYATLGLIGLGISIFVAAMEITKWIVKKSTTIETKSFSTLDEIEEEVVDQRRPSIQAQLKIRPTKKRDIEHFPHKKTTFSYLPLTTTHPASDSENSASSYSPSP